MAVTITRTPWVDDDGSGSTGTVINNAVKTSLYNEIDTALAKVAQLAGGNSFTGTQTMTALNSVAALQFFTTGAERMRITPTGEVFLGTTVPLAVSAFVAVAAAANAYHLLAIQNTSSGNSGNFALFLNSASGQAGAITHTGAGTVAFVTTSDARLKDDAGRAVDLAALRAVVVHDFTWKADGIRDRGIFAQDAHALYPRAVVPGTDDTTDDGTLARPWMTDYSKFVPDLIVGWQQHDAKLAELRAILAAVKG